MWNFYIFLLLTCQFYLSVSSERLKCDECTNENICVPPFYQITDKNCEEENKVCCTRRNDKLMTLDKSYDVIDGFVKINAYDKEEYIHIGAGVLVHPNVVLTVAHIVSREEYDVPDFSVNYTSNQSRNISKRLVSKRYNPSVMIGDLALLVMHTRLEKNQNYSKKGVMRFQEYKGKTANCVLATTRIGEDFRNISMEIVSQSSCERFVRENGLAPWYHLPHDFLCAIPTRANADIACTVDPGAPLLCQHNSSSDPHQLVGTATWSLRTCDDNKTDDSHNYINHNIFPIVFTNIANHRKWIDEILSIFNPTRSTF